MPRAGSADAIHACLWSAVYVDAMVCRNSYTNGTQTQRLYVQQDANWNVTAITDTSGNVLERYAYDAYGNVTVLNPSGTAKSPNASAYGWRYLYQGGRYDAISGLYNFRNRDYSPTLERWMQQDPLGYVDGSNVYRAMGDNPIASMDPFGLQTGFAPTVTPSPVTTLGPLWTPDGGDEDDCALAHIPDPFNPIDQYRDPFLRTYHGLVEARLLQQWSANPASQPQPQTQPVPGKQRGQGSINQENIAQRGRGS